MTTSKIHVYFMPGMAANPTIFKNIKLPEEQFKTHWLSWEQPEQGISFNDYAKKICSGISHKNPVLVGVSFGGMLAQEMAKCMQVRKVIIISSVKQKSELPKRLIFAKYTKLHKLLPTGIVTNLELLTKYAFGETVNKRMKLYEEYLSIRDKYYLDWAIDNIVNWQAPASNVPLVHIHGEKDAVFPIQYIKDCITVKNGTHTMIIHRAKWFNERLPTIILE